MRLRLAIGIVGLPLFVPACFSSNTPNDLVVEPPVDAAAIDATTIPEAAAPDAGLPEAAPEAATPEAATPEAGPLPVTVVVVTDRGPEPGVAVVFQDSTGNAQSTVMTDTTGRASQVVPTGSQITVVLGTTANVQLLTIEGVAPGDVLTAHDATDTTLSNALVSIDGLPGSPPDGTNDYIAQIGNCSAEFASPPGVVEMRPGCENAGTFPILVQALGPSGEYGESLLGFTYQNGNTLPLDGGTAHVTLNGPWSTTLTTQSIAVQNELETQYTYSEYTEIANGVGDGNGQYVEPGTDGGGSAQYTAYPGYPTSIQSEVNVSATRGPNIAVSAIATRGAPSLDGGTATFDMSTLLPLLDNVTLDMSQPAQPTVSWVTEAGSLAGASGTIVMVTWNGTNDGGDVQGTWTIVAPPTATSVQAPLLPAALSAWEPTADANFSTSPAVIVVQGSFLAGYADLRAQFAGLSSLQGVTQDTFLSAGAVPTLPVDGTVRLTAMTYNAD
jgi:hypothetical protein